MNDNSRIALRFDRPPGRTGRAAALVEDGADAGDPAAWAAVAGFALPATSHAVGCACCLPRGPVALALGRLFLARARGEAPLFDTVVAVTHSPAAAAAVRAALREDVVTQARFRLADPA